MKKLIIFLLCLFPFTSTYAEVSNSKIAKVYSNFVQSLDKKYSEQKQTEILTSLDDSIDAYLERKLSSEHLRILGELQKHNNNYLFSLFTRQQRDATDQKTIELQERLRLSKQTAGVSHPSYINTLGKKIYVTNKEFDFVEDSMIQKVRFTNYFPLDSHSTKQLQNTSGIVVYSLGDKDYKFVTDYTFEEKVAYSKLQTVFDTFITKETNYVEENGVFFGYVFNKYSLVEDDYGVFLSDLSKLDIDADKELLYKDNEGKYLFIKFYEKKRLLAADIIDGITDKQVFLTHVLDDKNELSSNTDQLFLQLQKDTLSLTKGKTESQKIEAVYDWVLHHVQYTKEIDLQDSKIFSGIDTYKNGDGVCTGYTKLSAYMMMFAGVEDIEVIRGNVIDAQDFPQVGHAWLRIGNSYYDPTFDDPLGAIEDKKMEEYKYFSLPRDLFYTNRFHYDDTPEVYKKLPPQKRNDIVAQNLYDISGKYRNSDYIILKPAQFRKDNNISYNTPITPEVLSTVMDVYQVEDNSFSFLEGTKKRNIRSFKFYTLDDVNTEIILSQLNYDVEGLYLFDWETETGAREYRLAYDVIF